MAHRELTGIKEMRNKIFERALYFKELKVFVTDET